MGAPATWDFGWTCRAAGLPCLAPPVRGEPVASCSHPTHTGPLPCSCLFISSPGYTP